MLQFNLLKYVKYEDLIKFLLVCKDTGTFFYPNKVSDKFCLTQIEEQKI